jgi:hypothetical protein
MLIREHGGDSDGAAYRDESAATTRTESGTAPETRQSEPRLISTEVGFFVIRRERSALMIAARWHFQIWGFCPRDSLPKALTGNSSAEFLGGTNHPDSA